MFSHPFAYVMVATFIAAIGALLVGMLNLAGPREASTEAPHAAPAKASRSTNLMFLRVALCFALLVQIVIYLMYIKPAA